MSNIRLERVNGELCKSVYKGIEKHVLSRCKNIILTVTKVDVSADLSSAKVFVSIYSPSKNNLQTKEDVLNIIKNQATNIRRAVAEISNMKRTPKLTFFYDDTEDKASRIDDLFNKIKN